MKKGFTLIELLAVIVILAIISLIAIPIILNIIEDTKEESNQRSMELYAEAIRNAIANYELVYKTKPSYFSDIEGYIKYDGKVKCDETKNVLYEDYTFYLGECSIPGSEKLYTYGEKFTPKTYQNGEVVYFDVANGIGCTKGEYEESYNEIEQDYLNSKTGYNGIIIDANKDGKDDQGRNSCLKFYAFNDEGGDTLNLLLDHNTTAKVAWNSSGKNSSGPSEVLSALYDDTKAWDGTINPKDYKYKNALSSYEIKYSGFKARLIIANEVAKITGANEEIDWNEGKSTNHYYLDGAKGTNEKWQTRVVGQDKDIKESEYYWLFDRTYDCKQYGCLNNSNLETYGYWSNTACYNTSNGAWTVFRGGSMTGSINHNNYNDVGYSWYYGVRPVIEVLKSKLK